MNWGRLLIALVILSPGFSLAKTVKEKPFCEADVSFNPFGKNSYGDFIEDFIHIDWWGASEEQIRNAKCANPEKLENKTIREHFDLAHKEAPVSQNIFGMNLEDAPGKLELLKKLLTVEDITLYGKIDEQPSYEAPDGCKKVDCAAAAIFGQERGPKILYALDKYGVNMSHLRVSQTKAWEEAEIDNVLEALDDLPPTLVPFERNRMMGKHIGRKGSTLANATMMFYGLYDEESEEMQRYTVVHELGHNVGNANDLDESPQWLEASGWVKLGEQWILNEDEAAVSKYGKTNPAEDFAETFATYRYNPKFLKEVSPEKYKFMKNYVFQGLEYTSEQKCQTSNSYLYKVSASASITNLQSMSACEDQLASALAGRSSKEKIHDCVKRAMVESALDVGGLPLEEGIDPAMLSEQIKAYGKDYVPDSFNPSEQDIRTAVRQEIDRMVDSYAQNYFMYQDRCDDIVHGNQRFSDYGDDRVVESWSFRHSTVLNEFSKKVCRAFPTSRYLDTPEKVSRLREMFHKSIPY